MRAILASAISAVIFLNPLFADDAPPGTVKAGHSVHGEAFNEGPRQAARLLSGTGAVHFEVTAATDEARAFFKQGVGQLHGFWYFESERSFRQVAKLDPKCAMAYWGMAFSNLQNVKRGTEFIKKAVELKSGATRREQLWIGALESWFVETKKSEPERRKALVKAMEALIAEFPDDIEAKAFLAFHIWDNSQKGIEITSRTAVDALLSEVLAKEPMHPAHHYRIHLWNYEADARALKSAALCGQSAPGVAHMWHMPGHTFVKLDRFADAAWQQEAAARVDHAHMIASRILPEEIHNYAHNNGWLVENLGHIGRVRSALELAKNMIELPRLAPGRHPLGKDKSRYDEAQTGHSLGQRHLLNLALDYELWTDLTELDGTVYLAPADGPVDESLRLYALGTAYFSRNNATKGRELLTALETHLKTQRDARFAAGEAAEKAALKEKKSKPEATKAMADAMVQPGQRLEKIENYLNELRLREAIAKRDTTAAKGWLDLAKALTPIRKARLLQQLGQHDDAIKTARDAVNAAKNRVLPLAVLADIQNKAGKKDDALETFKKLRSNSSHLDLGEGVFLRLAPLATAQGHPADWREKNTPSTDTGTRPALSELGPFRWTPPTAPAWTLPDADGKQHALESFHGKPVIVVFYLGAGCVHCIEQLNLLAPLQDEYTAAGLSIIAISTDTPAELNRTFAQAKAEQQFRFPIVADPELATFKNYRCYDDFEAQPLHGTFLIDAQGLIRWQDISAEPFRDLKWLLSESKRLLALPQPNPAAAAKTN